MINSQYFFDRMYFGWLMPFLWDSDKEGTTSIKDAPRPGSPKSAVTPENIVEFHDIVLADRRVKMRELAETVEISINRVHFILHHELYIKKLYARWVTRLLTL